MNRRLTEDCMLLRSFSLSGNNFVLWECYILADAAEGAWSIIKLLGGVDAFTHTKWIGVIKELHLILSCNTIVDGANTWVLLVEPWALHISLLLRIVFLRVNLADQVGDLVDTLSFSSSGVASSKSPLSLLESSGSLSWGFLNSFTEVVPIFSAEVASFMSGIMSWDNSAKALRRRLDWSVYKRKLSNVVLIDHAEHGLLLSDVDFGILNFLRICRLKLPL